MTVEVTSLIRWFGKKYNPNLVMFSHIDKNSFILLPATDSDFLKILDVAESDSWKSDKDAEVIREILRDTVKLGGKMGLYKGDSSYFYGMRTPDHSTMLIFNFINLTPCGLCRSSLMCC